MTGGHKPRGPPLALTIFFLLLSIQISCSSSSPLFTPHDNFLINCGASDNVKLEDGRTFVSDPQSSTFLNTNEDVKATTTTLQNTDKISSSYLPLFLSSRIFPSEATYKFPISQKGLHFLRLYFYPVPHPSYNLTTSAFRVSADNFVLLHDFSINGGPIAVQKEYLLNLTSDKLTLKLTPKKNSVAFINAIELISAPASLMASPVDAFGALVTGRALEVSYRLNVGGPLVTPANDTLFRTWGPDTAFMPLPGAAESVSIASSLVVFPNGGATPLIAPSSIYSTADQMANSQTSNPNFNLTWRMQVDPSFDYLVRLHFCDVVSIALNQLYFNVYLNGVTSVSGLDLSQLTGGLATAYYRDFIVNSTSITNGSVSVQVGPMGGASAGPPNAILNGVEVIKISNAAGSLSGLFNVNGVSYKPSKMKIIAGVGLAMGATAMLFVGAMFVRWHKRPHDWERRDSFSSWLLPLNASTKSFLSNKSGCSRKSSIFGSRKSRNSISMFFSSNNGVGKFFTFNELQQATNNFDEKAVIGVGGFGKVYLGTQEDGTKLAIKRGNPQSEQGINEFQTELQMLSQLRHRHLVSLIGYCDEGSEMILVYEYMSNGVLREHLYSTKLENPLSWKQRLEICIGAARGLHYLHTGASHCIIHRDVKTTNILLDENFVAKVSDFGLSKAACLMEQTHVSTAVKGSFGYLDPEYFRRQQLTEKSDVYSFGVVLFEVLLARPAINPALSREQVNLAEWAMSNYRKGNLEKIVDPNLQGKISSESLKKFVEAAEKCLLEYGVDRPSMGDVLWNLEYALQLQEATSQQMAEAAAEDKSSLLIPLQMITVDDVLVEEPETIVDVKSGGSSSEDHDQVSTISPFSNIDNFQGR